MTEENLNMEHDNIAQDVINEAPQDTQQEKPLNKIFTNVEEVMEAYGVDIMMARTLMPIMKFMDVSKYSEVVINEPFVLMTETHGGDWTVHDEPELTLQRLEDIARVMANMTGQLYHNGNPILSCKMPGQHRVQVVGGFHAPRGFNMAIRLFNERTFSIDDFEISEEDKEKIITAVKAAQTLLISGGTGSGKTSFINSIIPNIPADERLVSMEDVPELKIPHKNWCQLTFASDDTGEGAEDVSAIINACLRLRPDRIIMGEIRKENAFGFCSAINTGHNGSLATIHANNPKSAVDAVLNRVLMNGEALESTMNILRRQLMDDIHGVVQLNRQKGKVVGYYKEIKDGEFV
ncbi:MAG: Flp pilus assembly complex ATPase component [Proteobacteria bacterium]|nr:Flp pilus assembly complex ATPase component [Pseudomonadota bacterium]